MPTGTPYQLQFLQQPPSQVYALQIVTPPIEIEILDSSGNLVTDATDQINLGGGVAGLGGNDIVSAVGGIAVFNDIFNGYAANGIKLVAQDADYIATMPAIYSNAFDVLPVPTATTLTVTPNTSTLGQTVTLTAYVTALVNSGGSSPIIPAGAVQFTSGGTVLGSGGLYTAGGINQATLNTSELPAGSDTTQANYIGYGPPINAIGHNFVPSSGTTTAVVNPVGNTPPTLVNPGNQTNNDGDTVSLQLQGSDTDGDSLTYSESGLPAGLGLDPNSGLISGTITAPPAQYTVTATVDDGNGNSASQSFVWTVAAVNTPPILFNPGSQTNQEGDTVSLQIVASDLDGDTLTYSFTNDPIDLTINPATGLISGVITAPPALYGCIVSVDDGHGNSASQGFSWTVTAAAADHLAFIQQPTDSIAGSAIAPAVAVAVEDRFGNVVTSDNSTVGLALNNNGNNGVLNGTLSATVSGGIATFSNLFITQTGTGYTLQASDGALTPAVSDPFTVALLAPAAPANVTATPDTVQVAVSWNAVNGAASYNIYRSTTKGGEGAIPYQKGVVGTYFSDTNVTGGTTYYYQVTAVDGAGESAKSQESAAAPLGRWTIAGQGDVKTLTMNMSVAVIGFGGNRIDKAKVGNKVNDFIKDTNALLSPIVGQGQIEIVSGKSKVVYIVRMNFFIANDKVQKPDFQLNLKDYAGLGEKIRAAGLQTPALTLKALFLKYKAKIPVTTPGNTIVYKQYLMDLNDKGTEYKVDFYRYPVIAKFVEASLNLKPDNPSSLLSLLNPNGGAFVLPSYYGAWVDYINKTVPGKNYEAKRNLDDQAIYNAMIALYEQFNKKKK